MTDLINPGAVRIKDGRNMKASFEDIGFKMYKSPSKCTNLEDEDQIRDIHYPEVEELVKRATGAPRVIVFDHTVRITELDGGSPFNLGAKNKAAAPVAYVHSDYTEKSAPARVKQMAINPSYTGAKLTKKDVKNILKPSNGYCFINVWRNT